jgi:RNA-directed DNA polymerase
MTTKKKNSPALNKLSQLKALDIAWRVVRASANSSKSEDIREEARRFELEANLNIRRIQKALRNGTFRFDPAIGIVKGKDQPANKRRPLVLASIRNRIVHRSILNVLTSSPKLSPYFRVETSFAGFGDEWVGVRNAIEALLKAIKSGKVFYIRSDIQKFFTKIPKSAVLVKIGEAISDPAFLELLKSAITVELSNLDMLGEDRQLFPLYEEGVAQGCSLSPLLGNIALNEFDAEMNSRGIVCLRYIDDFILLGSSQTSVEKAFKKGQQLLGKLSMNAYDPLSDAGKAECGHYTDGIHFLGCDIYPGMVSPGKKSRKKFRDNVRRVLSNSLTSIRDDEKVHKHKLGLVDTLKKLSNSIEGWGNQYSFCNNHQIMQDQDKELGLMIGEYIRAYAEGLKRAKRSKNEIQYRRLMGVKLLTDCKRNPIIY